MNGRERTLATIKGEYIDRIPVAQHNFMFVVKHAGLSLKEYVFNPDKAAKALADTAYDFGYDCIIIDFDTCALAEAMGADTVFPENEPARIEINAVKSLSEITDIPLPDPEKDGHLPLWLETTKLLRKIVGNDLAIMARANQGPFGLLFLLRGAQEIMFDFFDEDEKIISAALEHCKNAGVSFAKAQLKCGADITSIGDGAAGESLISPDMYKRFSQPFEKKYKQDLGDGVLSLHICGKTDNIVDLMVETGSDILELDHLNNLDQTFQTVNNKACIFGNIDPSSILYQGTVDMAKDACREIILSARKHNAKFVLCPGCLVNSNTPPKNIKAMSEITKEVMQVNNIVYVFPETNNFRETRPLINWEHMYGWIDGYGILFDPIVQQKIKSVPEWTNGWNGVNKDADFIITSCAQASAEVADVAVPGIYIRPSGMNAEKRLSEKELIQTPIGDYYYPCHLPFDKYKSGSENWKIAGSPSIVENDGKLHVAFELFSMIWSWNGDWPERRLIEGADIFTSLLSELNPGESNNLSDYSNEFQSLRVDFQAYGINRFFIQWFLECCGEDKNTVKKADYHYLRALKLFNSGKFDAVRKSLKDAFSELAGIRKLHSKLEMYFLDFPHLGILLEDKGFFELEWPQYTRETMLSYFDNVEKHGYKVSLEGGASCWNQLTKRFPELGIKLSELWDSGKIDLTNGTYSLPYALVSPLILQYWQFKLGKETFEKIFQKSPVTYQCQENSLTPQLPELLLHFGYKKALHITQNHGEAPEEDVDFIQWQSPAGLSIPAMTVKDVILSRKAVNYFLDLPLIHHEYADDDQAMNYINFMDIGYVPFRLQMIRAHKYADIWGSYALTNERFESAFMSDKAPLKTYTADSYKISAGAFYPNETNANALSHYENIFQKTARLRQLELTEYCLKNQTNIDNILEPVSSLCLLEAHDMSYVQGQRRGEFHSSFTINPPPYSREKLTEEVDKINGKLECDLNKLTSEASSLNNGKLLFNASESSLSFARVVNPDKYNGGSLLEYDGNYYACGSFAPFNNSAPDNSASEGWKEISTIAHDATAVEIVPDNTGRLAITYKDTTLHCIPVSCREAAFTPLSIKSYTSGSLYLIQCLYQLNGEQLQSVMLDIIYSKDSEYIEFNLKYAPSNDFDVVDRWSDYLALEFDFGTAVNNIWRFNPNVRSVTNEDRIVSPYYLGLETTNGNKISLLNEGSFHYDVNRSDGKIRWLFHVASETVHKRRMALAFDTTDAFLLSRAWSQGVIPVNNLEEKFKLSFLNTDLNDISIEGFVEDGTVLISNLRDRIIASPFPNGTILKNMLGKKINYLNPFELALLEL